MKPAHILILPLFSFAAAVSTAVADNVIVVAAQETVASVAPPSVRDSVVSLPPLTFKLRAAIRCVGDPVSVTLSVADTFVTRDRDELDGQRAAEASLTVPAQQLAMAPVRKFCTDDENESEDELLAQGFATVHASLQCEDESGISVLYASAPLNVKLSCVRQSNDSEVDQEPSTGTR